MIGINDEGGYSIKSFLDKGPLKTLVGGGSNQSNLSIPYGLYSSNTLDYKDDNSDNNNDDIEDSYGNQDDDGVVDDDIYDNLLALMDAENQPTTNDVEPNSIELIVAEISTEPSTLKKKTLNKSRKHKKSKFIIQKTLKKMQKNHKPEEVDMKIQHKTFPVCVII